MAPFLKDVRNLARWLFRQAIGFYRVQRSKLRRLLNPPPPPEPEHEMPFFLALPHIQDLHKQLEERGIAFTHEVSHGHYYLTISSPLPDRKILVYASDRGCIKKYNIDMEVKAETDPSKIIRIGDMAMHWPDDNPEEFSDHAMTVNPALFDLYDEKRIAIAHYYGKDYGCGSNAAILPENIEAHIAETIEFITRNHKNGWLDTPHYHIKVRSFGGTYDRDIASDTTC